MSVVQSEKPVMEKMLMWSILIFTTAYVPKLAKMAWLCL